MLSPLRAAAALLVSAGAWLSGAEICTGFMIGPKYDPRAFYVRPNSTSAWQKTYSRPEYRRPAQGKVVGIRLAAALSGDEALSAALGLLDGFAGNGLLVVGAPLQEPGTGGNAFDANGSLRPEWTSRLQRLLEACDRRGLYVELILFHEDQDQLFESPQAILAAARNITDWLIDNNRRNVILTVADGWSRPGWDFDAFVTQQMDLLIDTIRERYQAKRCDYVLPVAIGADKRLAASSPLVQSADLLMLSGELPPEGSRRIERPAVIIDGDQAAPASLDRAAGWFYSPQPGAASSAISAALNAAAQATLAHAPGGAARPASK